MRGCYADRLGISSGHFDHLISPRMRGCYADRLVNLLGWTRKFRVGYAGLLCESCSLPSSSAQDAHLIRTRGCYVARGAVKVRILRTLFLWCASLLCSSGGLAGAVTITCVAGRARAYCVARGAVSSPHFEALILRSRGCCVGWACNRPRSPISEKECKRHPASIHHLAFLFSTTTCCVRLPAVIRSLKGL